MTALHPIASRSQMGPMSGGVAGGGISGLPGGMQPGGMQPGGMQPGGAAATLSGFQSLSPSIKSFDPLPTLPGGSSGNFLNFGPLKPNEFQKYVLETTGNKLPLHGASLFEGSHFLNNEITNTNQSGFNSFEISGASSVSGDYPIGPGDQLIIRGWGSIDIDVRAVVDSNGFINVPKIGSIYLSGVKFFQAEGVIKSGFSKYFKDFQLSVSMGQLRAISIYVVGQARRPGTYSISSISTLATAFFRTGGPNNIGSLRQIQLKRAGQLIAEFDLYEFLKNGNNTGNIKLIDGDVISIPPASGYAALTGKVNNPAIYELKNKDEPIDYLVSIAGGLSITADLQNAIIDRINPQFSPPRTITEIYLYKNGINTLVKNGDIIDFQSVTTEISNSITLRGAVSQPKRMAWKNGMRISDVIPSKENLISKESLRRQNEVLFNVNQRERTQRERENIPVDLLDELTYDSRTDKKALNETKSKQSANTDTYLNSTYGPRVGLSFQNQINRPFDSNAVTSNIENSKSIEAFREARSARLFSNQNPIKINERNSEPSLTESIGNLYEEINWEYAVIERLNRNNLTINIIPFNLGKVLDNEKDSDNHLLTAGDVITILTVNDIRIPVSKRRVVVRGEGEVANPGIYLAKNDETLTQIIQRSGGLTHDAYLFGTSFYREEVRKSQIENLEKLLRKLEAETSGQLAQASQSLGATSDASLSQARILSAQQAQRQSLDRIRNLKPEGRISLGLDSQNLNFLNKLPNIRLQNGDRIYIPPRPDFIYIYGAVNTESALVYKEGKTVKDYLEIGGVSSGADRNSVILIRADGSALTRNPDWYSSIMNTRVMPGDSIVMPDKIDREASWSAIVRNAKDVTQIFYQLGLGAAGLKALG